MRVWIGVAFVFVIGLLFWAWGFSDEDPRRGERPLPSSSRVRQPDRPFDEESSESVLQGDVWAGRVVDVAGRAVARARVYLVGTEGGSVTDESGQFQLPAASASSTLNVEPVAHLPRSVALEGAPHRRLKIVVELGAMIRGRVVTPSGHPVGAATVVAHDSHLPRTLDPTDRTLAQGVIRSVETAADGWFRLPGLNPESAYDLRARRPGFEAAYMPVEIRPIERYYRISDSPVELRLRPLYMAVVRVRFRGCDYTSIADLLFVPQNLTSPEGSTHVRVVLNLKFGPLDVRRAAANSSLTSSRLRAFIATPPRGHTGPISFGFRNRTLGRFHLPRDLVVKAQSSTESVVVQEIELKAAPGLSFGRIRVRRSDGKNWPATRMPLAIQCDAGELLTVGCDVTEDGMSIQSPLIPVGGARVWVPDGGPSARRHSTSVRVAIDANDVTMIEYAPRVQPVKLRLSTSSGLPIGRVDVAVMDGMKRLHRHYVTSSRGHGVEFIARDVFAKDRALLLLVRVAGSGWIKRRLDVDTVREVRETGELMWELPNPAQRR